MSTDFRGDPSAALLEVLDPEQNHTFNDHYLDLDYDLSDVMFITTANTLHGIPVPLQDRMEIIQLPGYTEFEKVAIAEQYLIPKQKRGQRPRGRRRSTFTEEALRTIIHHYTQEAGVRNLEREIATRLPQDRARTWLASRPQRRARRSRSRRRSCPSTSASPKYRYGAPRGARTRSGSSTASPSRCSAATCSPPRSRSSRARAS